jgi:hypothetical protein
MDKRTTTLPAITAKQHAYTKFLFRALKYWSRPIISRVIYSFRLKKWGHNSDYRVLDWDWGKINFNRIAVVNLLLNKFQDPSYLEIGCASDNLFNSVPVECKVGVDPSSGGNVRETSDTFFKANNKNFDVVFVDGLHTYEQARRDIINSINALNEGGWIAVHDMLPRSWIEHHVPMISQGSWTGDVWKVAFELIQTEGIEFKIVKIDHGVGVIKVIKKGAQLKDFQEQLLHKNFTYYYDNLANLPIIEWKDAQDWLKS